MEGEDGRMKVLGGERVHGGVVSNLSEDVGDVGQVDRRRWAGGKAGGRGGDSGGWRGETRWGRDRGGRRGNMNWGRPEVCGGKCVADNDGLCVVLVELGSEQKEVGNEIT